MDSVFAHNVDAVVNSSIGDSVDAQRPMSAPIVRAVDVGTWVVQAMPVNRNVCAVHVEMRRLDYSDLRPCAQPRGRHIFPMSTIVATAPDQAVIRARPDEPPVER